MIMISELRQSCNLLRTVEGSFWQRRNLASFMPWTPTITVASYGRVASGKVALWAVLNGAAPQTAGMLFSPFQISTLTIQMWGAECSPWIWQRENKCGIFRRRNLLAQGNTAAAPLKWRLLGLFQGSYWLVPSTVIYEPTIPA